MRCVRAAVGGDVHDGVMATDAEEYQKQAQAALRAELLATGTFDVSQLCGLRRDPSMQATEHMIRDADKAVLAIAVDGRVIYPAFQFTAQGVPREEISTLIEILQTAGLGSWQAWTWLVEPTPLLSGGVPVEMIFSEPRRAMKAVTRLAARVGR